MIQISGHGAIVLETFRKSFTNQSWRLFNVRFKPKPSMQNSAYRKLLDLKFFAICLLQICIKCSKIMEMSSDSNLKETETKDLTKRKKKVMKNPLIWRIPKDFLTSSHLELFHSHCYYQRYSQGKTFFCSMQYEIGCLATSDLFHMYIQSIMFYTFHYTY